MLGPDTIAVLIFLLLLFSIYTLDICISLINIRNREIYWWLNKSKIYWIKLKETLKLCFYLEGQVKKVFMIGALKLLELKYHVQIFHTFRESNWILQGRNSAEYKEWYDPGYLYLSTFQSCLSSCFLGVALWEPIY